MIEQASILEADLHSSAAVRSRWLAQAMFGALLAVLLLWPALYNRGVFLFPDTSTYIRGADAAVYKLTGHESDWTGEFVARFESKHLARPISTISAAPEPPPQPVVLAGRSIYYGSFAYFADSIGGLWLMAIAQAALTSATMVMAARRVTGAVPVPLLLIPLVTSAGFFATMIMPDFLAPLAIMAAAMIGTFWVTFRKTEKWFWSALLVLALISHSANILNVGGLVVLILFAKFILRKRSIQVMPVILLTLLALSGEWAFAAGVKKMTGQPPLRPPFVLARLIDDGPAYRYLREECPKGARFLACQYIDRMPGHSDTLLWSGDPRVGIFIAIPAPEQRVMAAQEPALLLAIVATRPGDVLTAIMRSTLRQACQIGLMEFDGRHIDTAKLPPRVRSDYLETAAAASRMPVSFFAIIEQCAVAAAALAIAAMLWNRRSTVTASSPEIQLLALIVAGLIVNTVVCGAMSTPHDRYLTRMLWLIPFLAVLLRAAWRQSSRQNPAT